MFSVKKKETQGTEILIAGSIPKRKCHEGKYQSFRIDLLYIHFTVRWCMLQQKANSHLVDAEIKAGKCAKMYLQNLAHTFQSFEPCP